MLWQTCPEHPPVWQSLSVVHGAFVDVPQNAGSIAEGAGSAGVVLFWDVMGSLAHAHVRTIAIIIVMRIEQCFMCCKWVFRFI